MRETFEDKINAVAAIVISMGREEVTQTIEILQRYVDAQKVKETSELVNDFMARMNEIAGNEDLACLFIPEKVWEDNDYIVDDVMVNDERGKYFVLLPEYFEGTVDNAGTPILKLIDREKE